MKLISFAVVSLLAITVSAYPPQSTSTQDMQSSQSTSTQTSQPSQSTSTNDVQSSQSTSTKTPQPIDQDKVQAEIGRLTKIYEEKDARFRPVDEDLKTEQEDFMNLEEKIKSLVVELQDTGLSSEDRESLEKMGEVLELMLRKAEIEYRKHYEKHGQVREDRDDAMADLKVFEENQRLMEEYNSKYGVQVGPSPRSLYNMKILEKQNTRILEEIRKLLEELKNLEGQGLFEDALKDLCDKLKNEVRILRGQSRAAERVLRWYKYLRPIGEQIKEVTGSYMWNSNI